jgi:hypothetical protein
MTNRLHSGAAVVILEESQRASVSGGKGRRKSVERNFEKLLQRLSEFDRLMKGR